MRTKSLEDLTEALEMALDTTLAEHVEHREDRLILARRTAEELCRIADGAMFYIPGRHGVEREERNRSIRALYRLRPAPVTLYRLARAYDLSPSAIRRIIEPPCVASA
jgi:Mor family transcriptional regulator